MTSEAKTLANRQNAQKSTGPRTPQGKAVASQNALKHGILAQKPTLASESPDQFEQYRDQILQELKPDTPIESTLAHRIVILSWRLLRILRIQNQVVEIQTARAAPDAYNERERAEIALAVGRTDLNLGHMAIKDFAGARILDHLLRYERATERSLYRAILEYQKLHSTRCRRILDRVRAEGHEKSRQARELYQITGAPELLHLFDHQRNLPRRKGL